MLCVAGEDTPNHEPKVAFWCGKVNQHNDLTNGQWTTDKSGKSVCATSAKEVLR